MMIKRLFFFFIVINSISLGLNAQSVYDDAKNHVCLKCHSSNIISFHNEVTGMEQKKLMNPYLIMDTLKIITGVHQNFDCMDCHSYEYETYPHPANLKLDPMPSCLDCHGGDPTYATYQFEKIDEEFRKSIHSQISGEVFKCESCHDQHTYKPTARNSERINEIVEYSNSLCLSCHDNMNRYEIVADKENPELVQVHNWLPNQELHFKNVRCIECHTNVVDSLMVSHNILPKTKAVKNCAQCHSTNSLLKASLYKYENLQARSEDGALKSVFTNQSYVIGTNQSPLLKMIFAVIFLAAFAGISVHAVFRILKK
jgi:predicted CXXCH cytochrome family protein